MNPSFTFLIPVLNAERHMERCLGSIRSQNYPQDKVEIIVLDGGCTDGTCRIAQDFGAVVCPNPGRLAEYGLQRGMKRATGELVVIFAADNELSGTDWLERAKRPFIEDERCAAVWGVLRSGPDDPPLNRYFELIQSDPLTHFMNRNIELYLRDPGTVKKDGRYIFDVRPDRPLVWGANGLVVRRSFAAPVWDRPHYLGDNDAFQQMVEEGNNRVAYIPGLVTYHHHVGELRDWVAKWKRNFSSHFLDKIETRNTNWVFVENFRLKLLLWLVYSTNPLISGLHSLYLMARDRNPYWAYHPMACLLQTLVYAYISVSSPKGRSSIARILLHRA